MDQVTGFGCELERCWQKRLMRCHGDIEPSQFVGQPKSFIMGEFIAARLLPKCIGIVGTKEIGR